MGAFDGRFWELGDTFEETAKVRSGLLSASGGLVPAVICCNDRNRRTGLEDVRQLPSVWTDKAPGGKVTSSLEGFHTFGSLKSVRKPLGNREAKYVAGGTGSSTPEELPLRVQSESRQSPNLSRAERSERSERSTVSTKRYEMYAH